MTQNEVVKMHLEQVGPLTQLEALRLFGIMRLGARILELREYGMDIHTELRTVKTAHGKSRIAVYSIK